MSKIVQDVYGISRLKIKNSESAIIQAISKNFNLVPKIAEAYYSEMKAYFAEHTTNKAFSGEILHEAVDLEEPAGKPLSECRRCLIKLTFQTNQDFKILKEKGLPELRREKIKRFCHQAIEQGTVLTYEDLAYLLTTSIGTVKTDARILRHRKVLLPTRGREKDIGRTISHKIQIVELYLKKYTFSNIAIRTHHSSESVERYLADFRRIIYLAERKIDLLNIRLITQKSENLIRQYLDIYQKAKKKPQQYPGLQDIKEWLKKGAL